MLKRFSYTLLAVVTVDLLATSGDITFSWSSPILPKLKSNDSEVNPFGKPITADEESWIGSLINIGAMVGPFPYGFISEKFGRRLALLCIAIPHIISYLTLAFSETVYLYYFARILGGLAVGGGYGLLPTYVAEVSEDANRGMYSTTLNIFWTFGNLLPYITGPYIPVMWYNVMLACIPTTFFISFFIIAPETPHYLVGKNKINEAEKSLMKLRSGDKKAVEAELKHIQAGLEKEEAKENFLDLFKSKVYLKGMLISLVLVIAQQLSGINAVIGYTQDIFTDAGVDGIAPEVSSIIIGLIIFLSSLATPFIVDRLGRRLLLLVSCFGTAISHFAFGLYFYLKDSKTDVSSITWLPIVSLMIYCITFNVALGPLPWTVSSELFPTSVKSYTSSLVSCACWTTSFLVTKFFNDLNEGLGHGETFWLFGGFCFITWIFTLLFIPETKGKSFKEIQEILEK